MKLGIVGQGAIGSLFAFYWQKVPPTLLLRRSSLNTNKSIIDLTGKEHHINSIKQSISSPQNTHFDVLLICVKSYQLAPLINDIKDWLMPSTRLILVQNGMGGAEKLHDAFPNNQLYIGTTTDAVFALDNVRYQITAIGNLKIGEFTPTFIVDKSNPKTVCDKLPDKWMQAFIAYHPNANWQTDIKGSLYTKLAINAVVNPLTGVLRVKNGQLRQHQQQVNVLQGEVLTIIKALGIDTTDMSQQIANVIEATADNYSSMYQDLKLHKTTEIDALLGYLLLQAAPLNIKVPTISTLYEKVCALQTAKHSS